MNYISEFIPYLKILIFCGIMLCRLVNMCHQRVPVEEEVLARKEHSCYKASRLLLLRT
jgi:hypothetical protein